MYSFTAREKQHTETLDKLDLESLFFFFKKRGKKQQRSREKRQQAASVSERQVFVPRESG